MKIVDAANFYGVGGYPEPAAGDVHALAGGEARAIPLLPTASDHMTRGIF